MSRVATLRPKRPSPILLCAKCVRRIEGGKAIRTALKAEIRAAAAPRPPKLVGTTCLGICPRRAVVAASGAMLARGEMLIVRDASEAADAAAELLGAASGPRRPT